MMDRKKLAAIIAVGPKKASDEEAPAVEETEATSSDEELELGHDLLDAIKQGDADAFAAALKDFVRACSSDYDDGE